MQRPIDDSPIESTVVSRSISVVMYVVDIYM